MTKYKGGQFYLHGYDLGQDTIEASMELACAPLDDTAITDTAESCMAGVRADGFEHKGMLDDAAGQSNAAAAALVASTNAVVATLIPGTTQAGGRRCFSGLVRELAFKTPVKLKDLILLDISGQSDGQMEPCTVLDPKDTYTVTTNGTVRNPGAGSAGAVGFLHVFAADGTVDVTIAHADSAGGAYTTLITFTQASTLTSERQAVTGAVKAYVKMVVTLGTATSVTCMVSYRKY